MKINTSHQTLIIAISLISVVSVILIATFLLNSKTPTQNKDVKCVISGCSGEICTEDSSDSDSMVSICIYSNKFACVAKTKCEVQTDGKCGWTANKEYNQCLMDADNTPIN